MKIAEIMSSPLHIVSSGRSVTYVSDLMSELKIGSLVVMDNGETVGIITSRDVRSNHPNRIVADAMTPNPVQIPHDQFVWDGLKMMELNQIERLLVADNDRVVGIVTRESLKIKVSEWLDPLTALYRSPFIQMVGEDLLNKQLSFQLLFLDINHFGHINKQFGHPIGDDVLQEYANRLKSVTNEDDFLCRYAGDEFVMITFRGNDAALQLAHLLSQPTLIKGIEISAAVGMVTSSCGENDSSFSFRDIISKASLISTSLKSPLIT